MEVMGASFSNLQLAQQSSSLAQSNMNSSHPNVPSSYATNVIPQPNALPVQTTISAAPQTQAFVPSSGSNYPQFSQAAAYVFADQPAMQSSGKASPAGGQHHTTRNLPSTANGAGVNYQVLLKCSVMLSHIVLLCKQYLKYNETKLNVVSFFFRKCSHSLSSRCHHKSSLGRAGG